MIVRLLTALLIGLAVQAQQTGSVQGTVIDITNRQPVRKAVVTLTSLAPDRSYAVAITDTSGQFSIAAIPEGRYRLTASHQGFFSIPYGSTALRRPGAVLNLASGETRTGIALHLSPANLVSGNVTDPEGDGIQGIRITFYAKQFHRRKQNYAYIATATTDRHGHYELSTLLPGEYWLRALSGGVMALRARPVFILGEKVPQESVSSLFYPGVDSLASASPVTVVAGRDTPGVDFHLNYVPQVSVHGVVSGIPEDTDNATLILEPDAFPGDRDSIIHVPVAAAKPSFRLDGIAAGSYRLIVETESRRAALNLRLTSPDTEANVELVPGVAIAGSVAVEGPGASVIKNPRISLFAVDDGPPLELQTRAENGKFEFDEVPAGRWDVDVNPLPRGAYIKSMRLGTQDVLTSDMEIGPHSKGPLDIVISTAGAKVEGAVEPVGPVTVLAAPMGHLAMVYSFYRAVQSDDQGHFTIAGLRPGAYRFFAFRSVDGNAWQDPKFLPPFESRSKSAELKEGATETLTLTVIGEGHP